MLFSEELHRLGDWKPFFIREFKEPYFHELNGFIEREISGIKSIYPPKPLIFNSFFETPLKEVKVVIVGQDPYHGAGQAHGLSFSVPQGIPPPPSLKNIFKELNQDLHIPDPKQGCLLSWAQQGVLLLNATLTVREGEPKSHYGKGWEIFTDRVILHLIEEKRPMVFLLWGKSAQEKCLHLLSGKEGGELLVLQTTHPSPLSAYAGFLGSRHFSSANKFLNEKGFKSIDWRVL